MCEGCGGRSHERSNCIFKKHPLYVHYPDTWEGSQSQVLMQKLSTKGKITFGGSCILPRLYMAITSEEVAENMGEKELKQPYDGRPSGRAEKKRTFTLTRR